MTQMVSICCGQSTDNPLKLKKTVTFFIKFRFVIGDTKDTPCFWVSSSDLLDRHAEKEANMMV